jgi:hypothetical protein
MRCRPVSGARRACLAITAKVVTDERVALFKRFALFRNLRRRSARLRHGREVAGDVPARGSLLQALTRKVRILRAGADQVTAQCLDEACSDIGCGWQGHAIFPSRRASSTSV